MSLQLPSPPLPEEAPRQGMYIIGSDDRPLDTRVVAVAIAVRADSKVGDREFSHTLNLHEAAVIRRFYESRGGSIVLSPYWPPGITRFRQLTQDELRRERDRMRTSFVIPRPVGQAPVLCFDEFFGAQPADQLRRLHAVMKEQLDAWNTLMVAARKRVTEDVRDPAVRDMLASERIQARELDEIANIADPSKRGLDEVELGEIMLTATPAPGDAPLLGNRVAPPQEADTDLDKALDAVTKAGFPSKALELVALLESKGKPDNMSDAEIAQITGNAGDAPRIRAALKGA